MRIGLSLFFFFFFQAEDGIRDFCLSRGLGDVYKRQDLYNLAIDIVTKAGFADNFMGATQKAKFIGHGIGLEINEMPVLAPRMKQELEPGMVFALEPKIVLLGIGPVGIENSWVVTAEGVEKLTLCKEEIVEL